MLKIVEKLITKTINQLNWKINSKNLRIFWNKANYSAPISSNIGFLQINQSENDSMGSVAEFAKQIKKNLIGTPIEKVINSPNGYLNFYFHRRDFNQIINEINIAKENFGKSNYGKGQKIIYEWVSANPTGNLHIGHLRNAIIGDCNTRILETVGYNVHREFYINDAGLQMEKAGETLFELYQKEFNITHIPAQTLYPQIDYLALLLKFKKEYSDQYKNASWKDPQTKEFFIQTVRNYFLQNFVKATTDLQIKFDYWFSEKKEILDSPMINEFLKKIKNKNLTESKDGALWFKAKNFGFDENIVLIKKTGATTYFLTDWIYHNNKYERGFVFLYDLWGADHDSHIMRISAALKALGHPNNFRVDVVQMVSLMKSKKILKLSKRAGNIVSLSSFVETLGHDFSRFMLITRKRTRTILLNVDLVLLKNSKNPVFYVQYAHARAYQLLKKYGKKITPIAHYDNLGGEKNKIEQQLILSLHLFPSIILRAAQNQEPQIIVDFLINFSKKIHSYYQNIGILTSPEKIKKERIIMLVAIIQVLKNALNLIGVQAPKKM